MANNDITFIRPEHGAASPIWETVRDVCRGPDAVKRRRHKYLPKLDPTNNSEENNRRNDDYLRRAVFYAIAGHTKNGLIGMAFRRDPTVTIVHKMEYLKTNANGAGISIYQQAQSVLESVLEVAREGLYVDYSVDMKGAIILNYRAEDIINWRTERINGRDKLVLVVLRECVEEPDGYGFKDRIQYRELAMNGGRFVCRVWRNAGPKKSGVYVVDSEYYPVIQFGGAWDEIPFTFVGAQNNDPSIDESPLLALTEINLGHYRNSADYEDSLFFCGQVQPWISGLTEEWRDWLQKAGVALGSRSPILLPKDGASGFNQAQPNMIAKEGMDSKRDYMISLGARLVEQNSAVKTATQATGDQAASTSVLGICCANVSEAYTQALLWCAKYMGNKDAEVAYSISQEFIQRVADSGMLAAIVAAWQSGAIRDADMIRAMQKLDIIDPESNPNDVLDELKNQSPSLTGG